MRCSRAVSIKHFWPTLVSIIGNPVPWCEAVQRLSDYAKTHPCHPPSPPGPLILSAWVHSNDMDKLRRWEETVEWAMRSGCPELVSRIPDRDFYSVEKPTSYTVGPEGGPMYRPWDFTVRSRPAPEQIAECMHRLLSNWLEIAGPELAKVTWPKGFTGAKSRRLLVCADGTATPPWGGWRTLSRRDEERRAFTRFRAAINEAISPHQVDHVDFTATAGS